MVYAAEKLLKDSGDKIDSSDKTEIESKINAVKEASKGNDVSDIKAKAEELQKAVYAASEKLYRANASQGQGGAAGAAGGAAGTPHTDANGNTVYDAEYKDVDDNDKK